MPARYGFAFFTHFCVKPSLTASIETKKNKKILKIVTNHGSVRGVLVECLSYSQVVHRETVARRREKKK